MKQRTRYGKNKTYHYDACFRRNMGVLTSAEQHKLRDSKVFFIGTGGLGGVAVMALARSGLQNFILADFDVYRPSNVNRQITCFRDTCGIHKTESLKKEILRVNPNAQVESYPRRLSLRQISKIIQRKDVDFVFPAADDYAFSTMCLKECRKQGKPSLFCPVTGTWAHISVVKPDSPEFTFIEGIPDLATYEEYREFYRSNTFKYGMYSYYVNEGSWTADHYRDYLEKHADVPQLCPLAWIVGSICAWEVVKILTGKWTPVSDPKYWSVTKDGIFIKDSSKLSFDRFRVLGKKFIWRFLNRLPKKWSDNILRSIGKRIEKELRNAK